MRDENMKNVINNPNETAHLPVAGEFDARNTQRDNPLTSAADDDFDSRIS